MSTPLGSEVPGSHLDDVEKKVVRKSSSTLGTQNRMHRASAKASRSTSLSEVNSISRFSDSSSIMGDPEKHVPSQDMLALRGQDVKIEALTMKRMATPDLEENRVPDEAIATAADGSQYPGPLALTFLTIGICLSVFLVSLDRTIVATAIPRITDEFHSSADVGWYGSAYLVTASALQPTYGRIFTLFDIKWSFLGAMAIFEVGSLICGVAPNSVVLIVGRAIAGFGSAGIVTGSFVVVAHSVQLVKRPVYSGMVGVMFGLGAVVGPLLGGVFTDRLTWRWCFYFNLPVGGFTVAAMVFLFRPQKSTAELVPLFQKILRLDPVGNALLLIASVMFFLPLQYNELGFAWSSARIVGLLVGSGVMAMIFLAWNRFKGDEALIPPKIIGQRSVAVSCVAAFFIYGVMLIHSYYLPIYFQAIRGASAIRSGVDMIAYMLANAFLSLFTGAIVSKIGYYTPPAIVGGAIATVGCGLMTTLQINTPSAMWIGYEVLVAAGLGMAIQQGFIAVQTVLPLNQVPIGVAAIASFQSLGGSIFVSVGNSILQNALLNASSSHEIPGVDVHRVISAGATMFRSFVPADALPALLNVYNTALQKCFTAAIPLAGLAFVAALGLEWRSIKGKKEVKETLQELEDETGGREEPPQTPGRQSHDPEKATIISDPFDSKRVSRTQLHPSLREQTPDVPRKRGSVKSARESMGASREFITDSQGILRSRSTSKQPKPSIDPDSDVVPPHLRRFSPNDPAEFSETSMEPRSEEDPVLVSDSDAREYRVQPKIKEPAKAKRKQDRSLTPQPLQPLRTENLPESFLDPDSSSSRSPSRGRQPPKPSPKLSPTSAPKSPETSKESRPDEKTKKLRRLLASETYEALVKARREIDEELRSRRGADVMDAMIESFNIPRGV